MKRSWARTFGFVSLLPLAASLGCDALTVRPFAGTVMEFTASNIGVTPAGMHLELWARNQYDDIIRIDPYYDLTGAKTAFGLMVRPAITLNDPCMIDGQGNLLTTAAAYPSSVNAGGVTQTPEQQAQQARDRITQLAPPGGAPLLAVLPYDPTPPPAVPATATAAERLDACNAYTDDKTHPTTYVGNPLQITAPKHGFVYGFVDFVAISPPTNYDGFRIDTPVNLKGVQEIFFTLEGATVDPGKRGPLFLISQKTQGGRGVVHFSLVHADPADTASGAAAVYVDLDEDPVQF